jgi:hypothetical protein
MYHKLTIYIDHRNPSLKKKQMTAKSAHHKITEGEHLREQGKAIRGEDVARSGETEINREERSECLKDHFSARELKFYRFPGPIA